MQAGIYSPAFQMKKGRSCLSDLPGIVHQAGETLGPLSGPSALSTCYTDARYSKMYILETVSGLGHRQEDRKSHPKSRVGFVCLFVCLFVCFWLLWGSQAAGGPDNETAMRSKLGNLGV